MSIKEIAKHIGIFIMFFMISVAGLVFIVGVLYGSLILSSYLLDFIGKTDTRPGHVFLTAMAIIIFIAVSIFALSCTKSYLKDKEKDRGEQ